MPDDLRAILPRTLAGRIEFVSELLLGPRIVDECGCPTGERGAPMITVEQAREMLSEVDNG